MSSPLKDARWHIATTIAKEMGFDSLSDMEYSRSERLLKNANNILTYESDEVIQRLADKWNSEDSTPEPVESNVDKAVRLRQAWSMSADADPHKGDRAREWIDAENLLSPPEYEAYRAKFREAAAS